MEEVNKKYPYYFDHLKQPAKGMDVPADARYCVAKALEFLELADIYIADMENEIIKLKKERDERNDEG